MATRTVSEIAELLCPLSNGTRRLLQPFKHGLKVTISPYGSSIDTWRVTLESMWDVGRLAGRIPGAKRDQHYMRCVLVPATDVSCLILESVCSEILFEDVAAVVKYKTLLHRFLGQIDSAVRQAEYKEHGIVQSEPAIANSHQLANYQRVATQCALGQSGYALFMEQGTGKTYTTISRIEHEDPIDKYPLRVLIVCPRTVVSNWMAELEKFSEKPFAATQFSADEIGRVNLLLDCLKARNVHASYLIGSYDSVVNSIEILKQVQWYMVVLDESHYIKNSGTKRWKKLSQLREKSYRRMILTGTPVTNTLMDLWTQLEFLGHGYSGFNTFAAFKTFHGVFDENYKNAMGMQKLIGFKNVPLLHERLARLSFIISKKEALPELPDKVYDIASVDMTPEQEEIYCRVATELQVSVENKLSGQVNELTISNILVEMLRLAQITSGILPYDKTGDGEQVIDRFDPNPKLEYLVESLHDMPLNSKAIVWSVFVPVIKLIAARLRLEGFQVVTLHGSMPPEKRDEAVKQFNSDPNTRIFVGNPAAGGVGINLLGHEGGEQSTNCDHVFYFNNNWSYAHRAQSEDRAHRKGTRRHVQYTDLIVPNTIDEQIRQRVMLKKSHAMSVSDLKQILKGLVKK